MGCWDGGSISLENFDFNYFLLMLCCVGAKKTACSCYYAYCVSTKFCIYVREDVCLVVFVSRFGAYCVKAAPA